MSRKNKLKNGLAGLTYDSGWGTVISRNTLCLKQGLSTPIYSRSLERKKVQAFCLLQIFFSGIRTT